MRPTFRLQNIPNWLVNITPRRVDSLPYSKIKSISHTYRQRLLAARKAKVDPTAFPPASIFLCQPTPSYVLSPQVAARLTKSDVSSLKSNLRVYESVLTGNTLAGEISLDIEERDCTPEFFIDQDLGGDQALYYGHGQVHAVGMLDMHRAGPNNIHFESAADLQRRLAEEVLKGLPVKSRKSGAISPEGLESWTFCNTENGQQEVARTTTDVGDSDGIATTSVTLNMAVPIPGMDPDVFCPHTRLAAAGIGTGPFTSIWACDGLPASDQQRLAGVVDNRSLCGSALIWSVQRAMGLDQTHTFVEASRALGKHDPDLEPEEGAE